MFRILLLVVLILVNIFSPLLGLFNGINIANAVETTLSAGGLEKKIREALISNHIPDWKTKSIVMKLHEDGYFYMAKMQKVRYINTNIKVLKDLQIVGSVDDIIYNPQIPDLSYKTSVIRSGDFAKQIDKGVAYWSEIFKGKDLSWLGQDGKSKWSQAELDLLYKQRFSPVFKNENRKEKKWTNNESKALSTTFNFIKNLKGNQALAQISADYGSMTVSNISVGTIKANAETGKLEADWEGMTINAGLVLLSLAGGELGTILGTGMAKKTGMLKSPKINLKTSTVIEEGNAKIPDLKEVPLPMGAMGSYRYQAQIKFWNSRVSKDYQLRKIIAIILDKNRADSILMQPDAPITFNDYRDLCDKWFDGLPSDFYDTILNKISADNKRTQYYDKITELSVALKSIPTDYGQSMPSSAQKLFNFPAYFLKKYPQYAKNNPRLITTGGTAAQIIYNREFRLASDIDVVILTDSRCPANDSLKRLIKNELSTYMDGRCADISFGFDDSLAQFIDNETGESFRKNYIDRASGFPKQQTYNSSAVANHNVQVSDVSNNTLRYIVKGKTITLADYENIIAKQSYLPEQNITRMIRFQIEFDMRLEQQSERAMVDYLYKYYFESSRLTDAEKLTNLRKFFEYQHTNQDSLPKNFRKIDQVARDFNRSRLARTLENKYTLVYIKADRKYYTWRYVVTHWMDFYNKFPEIGLLPEN